MARQSPSGRQDNASLARQARQARHYKLKTKKVRNKQLKTQSSKLKTKNNSAYLVYLE